MRTEAEYRIWTSMSYFAIRTETEYRIWTSISYFEIRTEAEYHIFQIVPEYRILPFKFLFYHSKWGGISYFGHQYPILPFKLKAKYRIWTSISYFTIRTEAEYRIWTSISYFFHSNWGRISFWTSKSKFDIRNKSEYRIWTSIILFCHSNWEPNIIFFQIVSEYRIFAIQDHILPFKMMPNIVFGHQYPIELRQNIGFGHSKSNFDIWNQSEYRIWTSITYFWLSNWGRILYFDIKNIISTFDLASIIVFSHSISYFNIQIEPNVVFWYSQSYFDIRIKAKYRIFDIQYPILTFELRLNNVFWHSPSYLTFEMRQNIAFWHSQSYFYIRSQFESQIGIECQNTIFMSSSNVKIALLNVKTRYSASVPMSKIEIWMSILGLSLSVTIGLIMSKYDIRRQYECQNRIFNVKMWYSATVSNNQNMFWMSNCAIWPQFECRSYFWMSKCDIHAQFESQNRIFMLKYTIHPQFESQNRNFECQITIFGLSSNVKYKFECLELQYLASVRVSNGIFEC